MALASSRTRKRSFKPWHHARLPGPRLKPLSALISGLRIFPYRIEACCQGFAAGAGRSRVFVAAAVSRLFTAHGAAIFYASLRLLLAHIGIRSRCIGGRRRLDAVSSHGFWRFKGRRRSVGAPDAMGSNLLDLRWTPIVAGAMVAASVSFVLLALDPISVWRLSRHHLATLDEAEFGLVWLGERAFGSSM